MGTHRILLLRHARTKGNEEKRYMGMRSDEPVSDAGLKQLEGTDMDKVPAFDRVFCSPMQRCIITAERIFPGKETESVQELTEMDFGLYEGKNFEELKDDPYYNEWIASNGRLPFPDGEDMAGFTARSLKAFKGILDKLKDGESAAIVCHGGNIMAILSAVTGGEYFDFNVGNIEGYIIDITYDGENINVLSYERFGVGMDT